MIVGVAGVIRSFTGMAAKAIKKALDVRRMRRELVRLKADPNALGDPTLRERTIKEFERILRENGVLIDGAGPNNLGR